MQTETITSLDQQLIDLLNQPHFAPPHPSTMEQAIGLIKNGANVNIKNAAGDTILHLMTRHLVNQTDLKTLLELGADPRIENNNGHTPVYNVLNTQFSFGILTFLIKYKGDINTKNRWGNTCLHIAAMNASQVDLIHPLLQEGADPRIKNDDGHEPMYYLLSARLNNSFSISDVIALCQGGGNINTQDDKGNTCLHFIAQEDKALYFIPKFIELGADPTIQNHDGKTMYDKLKQKNLVPTIFNENKTLLLFSSKVISVIYTCLSENKHIIQSLHAESEKKSPNKSVKQRLNHYEDLLLLLQSDLRSDDIFPIQNHLKAGIKTFNSLFNNDYPNFLKKLQPLITTENIKELKNYLLKQKVSLEDSFLVGHKKRCLYQ